MEVLGDEAKNTRILSTLVPSPPNLVCMRLAEEFVPGRYSSVYISLIRDEPT